jgi:hypothetical protein
MDEISFFMTSKTGNHDCHSPDCESFKTVNPPPPLGINTCHPRRLQHHNYANADLNRSLRGEIYPRQDIRDWLKDESSIDVEIYPSFGLSFRMKI